MGYKDVNYELTSKIEGYQIMLNKKLLTIHNKAYCYVKPYGLVKIFIDGVSIHIELHKDEWVIMGSLNFPTISFDRLRIVMDAVEEVLDKEI